jgi:hypothetical protein
MPTEVISLIEAGVAVLLAVSPIIISQYGKAKNAISIVQSFLDLLKVYGQSILDGTITNEEKIKIADAFIAVATVTHFDKTITATIDTIDQDTVDKAVNIVNAATAISK